MSLSTVCRPFPPIGTYWTEEPDENGCYSMRELKEGETAGELKSKNELQGPVEQLNEDYGTYYYMEDRAQERLKDIENFWLGLCLDAENIIRPL